MSQSPELSSRQRGLRMGVCVAVALVFLLLPRPDGVEVAGWRLAGIFTAVLSGLVLRPLPMGPVVLLGLLAAALSHSLSVEETYKAQMNVAMSGYGKSVVWLVVGAFLIASAVQGTGLGRRIALTLVSRLGRTTLGLAYAQCGAELVLGPLVPSNTARGGGILAPISRALSRAMGSEADGSPERAGAYLTLVGAHANLITAAMFLTGMAANGLVSGYAKEVYGVEFDWGTWALGALPMGLLSLALTPLVLLWLVRPTVRDGRPAQEHARMELADLGPMSRGEWVMLGVFVTMLGLWMSKPLTGLDTALVAWIGVAILIVTGTRSWDSIKGDAAAWDAMVWLGGLLTMATALLDLGVIGWFATELQVATDGFGMLPTVIFLAVAYFYSMYGFSMLTAHITAMALLILGVCHAAGVPALLAVPLIAYFSNLCACTTIYSTGPVIIYFGLGYVTAPSWFRIGFVMSLLHLAVWLPVGLSWWRVLGWW